MEHVQLLHYPTVDNLSDQEELETDESADSDSVANCRQEVHTKHDKKRKADEQEVN